MENTMQNKIKVYLEENPNIAIDTARELNNWDGRFPAFDTYYMSDMVDCMCCDHKSTLKFLEDVIYAAKSGEFASYSDDDFIRYDSNGFLEVRTQEELEEEVLDYLDEIVEGLIDEYPQNIYTYDAELKELLEIDEDDVEGE